MSEIQVGATSVFSEARKKVYRHRWEAELLVGRLVGGIPSDPKVIEAWVRQAIEKKGADAKLMGQIQRIAEARDIEPLDAVEFVNVNGFLRVDGQLVFPGRNVKACIKEAGNIAWPKRRWGKSNKGTRSFLAEHVFVEEESIGLGRTEPDDIQTRFVHVWSGDSINREEVIEDAKFGFTVVSDHEIDEADWAELWTRAEMNGLGAVRSQGYGRFAVTRWEKIKS